MSADVILCPHCQGVVRSTVCPDCGGKKSLNSLRCMACSVPHRPSANRHPDSDWRKNRRSPFARRMIAKYGPPYGDTMRQHKDKSWEA